MAKTTSTMQALGIYAPNFSLTDVISGKTIDLHHQDKSKAVLILFICNHCPYVKHINDELTRLGEDYLKNDVLILAINSNDTESYPEDSPENMRKNAEAHHYPFPYLFDETQEVARAYQAACTPDFFLFDNALQLVYRGQLDDSRPGNGIPVTGSSIREALDCLINNSPITLAQKPSLGCNIKWKAS